MLDGVSIRTKRWNDPAEPDDGYRLLICRYRPRGVSSDKERWDAWCKELGPSDELHADFYGKTGGSPLAFADYDRRFREEMKRQKFWLEGFAAHVRKGDMITLLCSSACTDPLRCHRTIVKELLEELAFPKAILEPATGTRVIRRTKV